MPCLVLIIQFKWQEVSSGPGRVPWKNRNFSHLIVRNNKWTKFLQLPLQREIVLVYKICEKKFIKTEAANEEWLSSIFSKTNCKVNYFNFLVCKWITNVYKPQNKSQLYAMDTEVKRFKKNQPTLRRKSLSATIRLIGLSGIHKSESLTAADWHKL